MKLCKASFSTVLLRFYLMMIIIVAAFLMGYPILALFGVPVFLTALMGIDFEIKKSLSYKSKPNHERSIIKSYPNTQNRWNKRRTAANFLGYDITKIFQISNNN